MKKGIGTIIISFLVLIVIGVGLYFWAYHPTKQEVAEKNEIERLTEEQTGGWQSKEKQLSEKENNSSSQNGQLSNNEDKSLSENSQRSNNENKASSENSQLSNNENKASSENSQLSNNENEPSVTEEVPSSVDSNSPIEEVKRQEANLIFAGDIYISPYVQQNYDREGINGVISERLLTEMKNGDITMANEEFPFSIRGEQAPDKQFTFRIDPAYVKILKDMKLNVVTLANNHTLDYGTQALMDTFDTLDESGIAYVGAGIDKERATKPFFMQAGQWNFGFLGASRVIPVVDWNIENQQPGMLCTYESAALCEAIQTTKQKCDFVIVYVHWGIEKDNTPQEYQRQLAKEYIDAGADLVVGAHPHVLQGIEYYNGKPIVYSLGNYIFNREIASTILLKVTITPGKETILQLLPAYATGAKTQEMEEEQAAEFYRYVEEISNNITIGENGIVKEN